MRGGPYLNEVWPRHTVTRRFNVKSASETAGRLSLAAPTSPSAAGPGRRAPVSAKFLLWCALVTTPVGLAACGSSLPCKPTVTNFSQPCEPGDWEWEAWGSCCRVECRADGRWHRGNECMFSWCGPAGAVEFDSRSASLRQRVDGIAARLSRMGGSYEVIGYVDVLERHETPGLDLRRAEAFRSALIDAGVCGERLVAVGGGVLQLPDQGNRRRWGGIARLVVLRTSVAADGSTGSDGGLK